MLCAIISSDEFDELLTHQKDFLLYKYNSKWCRISERTMNTMQQTMKVLRLQHVYFVDVITHKPLSEYIAKVTGIHHESPQLLIIKKGKVQDYTSHMRISQERIEKQII